jgi:transcriptional regulator with XRE-family HTH domain
MTSDAGRESDDARVGDSATWLDEELPEPRPALTVEDFERQLGLAVRRLRLYRGRSQDSIERATGIDQTTISRLEGGQAHGMPVRRLAAILRVLRADEVTFLPDVVIPPSSWEVALYGDPWQRADRAARLGCRLSRRRSA